MKKNNILIYDKSGKLLKSWGHEFTWSHGLTHWSEGGEDFRFISDNTGAVIKATVNGRELMRITHPSSVGAYAKEDRFVISKQSKLGSKIAITSTICRHRLWPSACRRCFSGGVRRQAPVFLTLQWLVIWLKTHGNGPQSTDQVSHFSKFKWILFLFTRKTEIAILN